MNKQKIIFTISFMLAIGAATQADAQRPETVTDSIAKVKFVEEMRKPWTKCKVYQADTLKFGPKPTIPPRKIEADTNFIKEMRKPWQEYEVYPATPAPIVDTMRRVRNREK